VKQSYVVPGIDERVEKRLEELEARVAFIEKCLNQIGRCLVQVEKCFIRNEVGAVLLQSDKPVNVSNVLKFGKTKHFK